MINQFLFFLPLAATSVLMMVTHSLFNAGITRLHSPEVYLAAFAVAKSLMHILECPVMMIRQTVTTLVEDRDSLNKVKRIMFYLIGIIIVVMALLALSDIGRWIFGNLFGLRGDTLDAAVIILRVLILFPIIASIRNYYHGIAIKLRMNPLITVATTIRIIFVLGMVIFINKISFLNPGVIAGLMFIGSVLIEACTMFIGIKLSVGSIPKALEMLKDSSGDNKNKQVKILNNKIILTFLWPLIVTAIIKTNAISVVNAGLARTISPEIAISTFAVAWSLGMIFVSPLFMFHQVVIQYLGGYEKLCTKQVKRFAIYMGVAISAIMSVIAFTDMGYYILKNIIGASEEISILSVDVLKIMVVMPIIIVINEYYFGMLVKERKTKYVGVGKGIQMIALIVSITGLTFLSPSNPALVGAIGIVFADGVECIYLYWMANKTNYSLMIRASSSSMN